MGDADIHSPKTTLLAAPDPCRRYRRKKTKDFVSTQWTYGYDSVHGICTSHKKLGAPVHELEVILLATTARKSLGVK